MTDPTTRNDARVSVTVRMLKGMKEALAARADSGDRTLSQEIRLIVTDELARHRGATRQGTDVGASRTPQDGGGDHGADEPD